MLKCEAAPIPISAETAVIMVVKGNATLVAPMARSLTPHPKNAWSTMLCVEFTSWLMIPGIANFQISLLIGWLPSGFSIVIFSLMWHPCLELY